MSRDPPRKKPKSNEEAEPDEDDEEVPGLPLESVGYYNIRQLELVLPFEQDVGSIGDLAVAEHDDESASLFSLFPTLQDLDWQEPNASQNASPSAFASFEDFENRLTGLIFGAHRDLSLLGIQLLDSPNVRQLRVLLPEYSDLLVAVILQLIAWTETREPRARLLIPIHQPPDARISQPNQSTTVTPQVIDHSSGRIGIIHKCWKCGEPMKGHSCRLPPETEVPGLFEGHDGRMWKIRLAMDVIEEMNDAAKENGVEKPLADEQCGKGVQKKRGTYLCNFCLYPKKSEFHRKHCILRPRTKVTLGGEDGKTWLHATLVGRVSKSKARLKEVGEGKVLENGEDEAAEDDRKPSAKDRNRESDGDGGKGDGKDGDNDDPPSGDGDGNGDGVSGVASYPV
ncbi:unnamed protein product [Cylindrotheca closterium]|uniref:Uncharacterized protein n=1 Tax=Cylindrotheca closterium TaxID=2856 RepID=A0AAD2FNQ3_9STRA|nr:unnamed protein product [Cylindrotheca closterium]